jgi:hypothetical protein
MVLLVGAAVAACGDVPRPSGDPTQAASGSANDLVPLPQRFPVMPGASRQLPAVADATLVARWTSDAPGPVAYAFYVDLLPAAGYPIVGLFPGGEAAVIRFRAANGGPLQLVLTRRGDGTLIELRLDRP